MLQRPPKSSGTTRTVEATSLGPHIRHVVVLVVADGLFDLCGPERLDELLVGTRPRTPFPVSDKPYGF